MSFTLKNKKNIKPLDNSLFTVASYHVYQLPPLPPSNFNIPHEQSQPHTIQLSSLDGYNISNITISNISLNNATTYDNQNSLHSFPINYKTKFDFYEELNNDDEPDENESEKCLISNLPLDKTKIEFECGHKFNYYYIFRETINSKKINYNVTPGHKLDCNSIKCPYCRTVYNILLPPSLDISETSTIKGINSPYKSCMSLKCGRDNCESKKIYVTPLGYYCKRHYYYFKSGQTTDVHCEENEVDTDKSETENVNVNKIINKSNKKTSAPELLHPKWELYDHYKVVILKQILKSKGLKVSGKKPYLISRLLNNNIQLFVDPIKLFKSGAIQAELNHQWQISQ